MKGRCEWLDQKWKQSLGTSSGLVKKNAKGAKVEIKVEERDRQANNVTQAPHLPLTLGTQSPNYNLPEKSIGQD